MKYASLAILSILSLTGCKENNGVHKGTFESDCNSAKGTLTQLSPNEYTCTLPDGTLLKTTDKK